VLQLGEHGSGVEVCRDPRHPYRQQWEAILLENCRRFAAGQPLINVVDNGKWF